MTEDEKLTELAKIAYSRYGKEVENRNYQGFPMPDFDALPKKIQNAWKVAAGTIYMYGLKRIYDE